MIFGVIMFLIEIERFIIFNGICKVDFIFNIRFFLKKYYFDIFYFLRNSLRFFGIIGCCCVIVIE